MGTSRLQRCKNKFKRDHPHACGDKNSKQSPHVYQSGSSPRVWGQVLRLYKDLSLSGIIPTRVGTRKSAALHTLTLWDHPHACGDKSSDVLDENGEYGSSPRVWGQASSFLLCAQSHGIIPTRVGTSFKYHRLFLLTWDHPHACGDKPIPRRDTPSAIGSSPRVWGQD